MTRYIDVDKFLKSMITKFKCVPLLGVSKYINGEVCFEGEHLDSLINETPTADVVEVVRCKGCKYFYQDGNIKVCKHWNCHSTTDDSYCSYGERRKEDEDDSSVGFWSHTYKERG